MSKTPHSLITSIDDKLWTCRFLQRFLEGIQSRAIHTPLEIARAKEALGAIECDLLTYQQEQDCRGT